MITSTPPTRLRTARAFTLVEVIIASTLSAFVLAGVLSAFVFLTQSGFRASGYNEMEAELRRGLERFARDTRNASDVHWNSSQSVTLTVNGAPVTYAYDATPASPTYRSFCRVDGDASAPLPGTVLIRNLDADFAFQRYKLAQAGVSDNTAGNDTETKQLQLTLRARRTSVATTGGSNAAVSARYILRNKQVSN
jgi:Tfp pilus assembly protein PilW